MTATHSRLEVSAAIDYLRSKKIEEWQEAAQTLVEFASRIPISTSRNLIRTHLIQGDSKTEGFAAGFGNVGIGDAATNEITEIAPDSYFERVGYYKIYRLLPPSTQLEIIQCVHWRDDMRSLSIGVRPELWIFHHTGSYMVAAVEWHVTDESSPSIMNLVWLPHLLRILWEDIKMRFSAFFGWLSGRVDSPAVSTENTMWQLGAFEVLHQNFEF